MDDLGVPIIFGNTHIVDASEIQAVATVDMVYISTMTYDGFFINISWWWFHAFVWSIDRCERNCLPCGVSFFWVPLKILQDFLDKSGVNVDGTCEETPALKYDGTSKFPCGLWTNYPHHVMIENQGLTIAWIMHLGKDFLLLEIMCCMVHFSSASCE